MEEHRDHFLRLLLANSLAHGGTPSTGAVLGKVMTDLPALRSQAGAVQAYLAELSTEVTALGSEAQADLLEHLGGPIERETRARRDGLPDLPGETAGAVLRFAPGPSGPLHLGHARAAILNDEYAKRYSGTLILRLEDTNPTAILPEAYDWIAEDMVWLDCKVAKTVIQSDRFARYHAVTAELIGMDRAYVCTCLPDHFKALKQGGAACLHREQDQATNAAGFQAMQDGRYRPGEATVRLKADLQARDEALRDFPLMRISEVRHPRTGDAWRTYPLMNLAVATDDHDLGLTHVIRGKDHLTNTRRQSFIFSYLGWEPPVYVHPGFVRIPDTRLKTSVIKEGIVSGDYSGWDDYRLGTLRALAKRGIAPQAIRRVWVAAGIKEAEISFSWDNLYAENVRHHQDLAQRFAYLRAPLALSVTGMPEMALSLPRHPTRPEFGTRDYRLGGQGQTMVWIDAGDLPAPGCYIRLKDACNLRVTEGPAEGPVPAGYAGSDPADRHGGAIIQFLAVPGQPLTVLAPDGGRIDGRVEPLAFEERGKLVQFERFGWCRIDPELDVAYWAHP